MSDAPLPKRKSIRLRGYDYAAPNWYFVTICVDRRRAIFGTVVETQVALSRAGRIVANTWNRLPEFYPVALENFVIMPNHLHGIVVIEDVSPSSEIPPPRRPALSEIIRGFKSMSAREINRAARKPRAVWQRGFYEHVIRDDSDLARIREYIDDNPIAWANDPENPDRIP